MRGADFLVRTLSDAGVRQIFALSGNQIMPVFDACIDSNIKIIHVRHEAAAVHMADAWGRLTGEPGVALITAGPGFANALSALYVARMAESPMVLLSGHAPMGQLGRGAFQEMPQAEMADHVAKSSWLSDSASGLGDDMATAFRVATSGRPGPVHVSLPFDVLEAEIDVSQIALPTLDDFLPEPVAADSNDLDGVLDALSLAERPIVLTGPDMSRGEGQTAGASLAAATYVPVVGMESPRGINDPSLGAFAEALSQADLVVLLGKKLDFTLQFGSTPSFAEDCRFVQIDAEPGVLEETRAILSDESRLHISALGDPIVSALQLAEKASEHEFPKTDWNIEVQAAIAYRPPQWKEIASPPENPMHAVEICRAVQQYLDGDENSIYVSDGGEFGQWAQACLSAGQRVINGPSGSIGSAIPFALAAREAFPDARIVTMLGDGTFGFLPAEFDTAKRNDLPFIAVVGNDSTWNAEYQIQLRTYGPDRLIGCELLPTRYDQVAKAFGGYGEQVTSAADLAAALERAHASGLPACVNVSMQRNAAPMIRRP